MNNILEVRESDFLVRVQPGVTRSQLEKELKSMVCFYRRPRGRRDAGWNGGNKRKRDNVGKVWHHARSSA